MLIQSVFSPYRVSYKWKICSEKWAKIWGTWLYSILFALSTKIFYMGWGLLGAFCPKYIDILIQTLFSPYKVSPKKWVKNWHIWLLIKKNFFGTAIILMKSYIVKTQRNSKQLALELDIVVTCSPPHPTPPPHHYHKLFKHF